jgi:hypothetical protein
MQHNATWLVDKVHETIYGFSYGRYVTKSFMEGATAATEIPDRFASVKLCDAPKLANLKSSVFVLLNKLPSEKIPPYCYEITYLKVGGGDLSLSNNDGTISKNNLDYWEANIPKNKKNALLSLSKLIN